MTSSSVGKNSTASNYYLDLVIDWTLSGIDFSVPGNGGLECRDHVTLQRRVQETFIGIGVASVFYGLYKFLIPREEYHHQDENNRHSSSEADKRSQSLQSIQQTTIRSWSLSTTFAGSLRLYLLTSLSFVFGMEVAYKFATKQLIWLLNPCHVTSFVQMYLLASEATSKNNHVFQMMLHVMHGPVAALVFPVTDSLLLPFEKEIYWIQHIIIIVIPIYLVTFDTGYTAHRVFQIDRFLQAFLAWSVWHWIVMQWISYLTLANVGSMLCAAASDPFTGPDYRLVAIVHQSLAIFLFGSLTASLCPQAQRGKLVGTNASSSNSKED